MRLRSLVCFACVVCFTTVCLGDGPLPIGARFAPPGVAQGPQERTRLAVEQIRSAADELEKLGFTDEAKSLRDTLAKIRRQGDAKVVTPAPAVKQPTKVTATPQTEEELQQVNCRIHIVELSGKAVTKWKTLSKTPRNNSGPVNSIHKNGEELLKLLEETGDVKVLSAPSIRTTLGQPASIMMGGEFPIIIPTAKDETKIEWRHDGVRCEVVPDRAENGKLRINFMAEIAERDYKHAVQKLGIPVPGLKTRRANTQSVLSSGETLAISVASAPSPQDESAGPEASKETITLFLVAPTLVDPSSK